MDLMLETHKTNVGVRMIISRYYVGQFSGKRTPLTFLAQICPKMDLWLETQKTNVGIRISILEILCVPIFRQNGQLWPKFAQKWTFGLEFQKSNCGFGISTFKIPCVPIFRVS